MGTRVAASRWSTNSMKKRLVPSWTPPPPEDPLRMHRPCSYVDGFRLGNNRFVDGDDCSRSSDLLRVCHQVGGTHLSAEILPVSDHLAVNTDLRKNEIRKQIMKNVLRYYNVKHIIILYWKKNRKSSAQLTNSRSDPSTWSGAGLSSRRNSPPQTDGRSALLRWISPDHAVQHSSVDLLLHCRVAVQTLHICGKQTVTP